MERRHLEYFLAVASHGSFTSAASALRIAQPSLSHTIKALERELGASLFHRLGRGVALTAAGEALLGPARQALREFETARAQVQQVAGLEAGRLDIVALTSLAVDPLARLVGAFRIAHPGIQIRIVDPERAVAVTELVRAGECELGLVDYSAPLGGLSALELPDQEIYAVLPPQHPEQADEPLTLKQVVALGLVTTPPGSATRTLVELALAELGEAPQVAVETPHRAALVPLVVAGAGATLLPRPMAEDAVPHGARVAPVVPPLTRRVRMVWRSGSVSAAGRAFIDMVPPAAARPRAHDSATSHRRGL